MIAGILLAGILAVTLAGCKNTDNTKEETEKPVITLGSDNYPPYNYLNEDGVSTGIDVELATEAFKRMGYQAVSYTHLNIVQGGRDYEVTVDFDKVGVKKMFASFAKLKKV